MPLEIARSETKIQHNLDIFIPRNHLRVEIATHILSTTNQPVPSTMAEAFISLERISIISPEIADKMKRSVGYRNVAIHNYDDIDLSITYDIANNHLSDFKEFIKQILHYDTQ